MTAQQGDTHIKADSNLDPHGREGWKEHWKNVNPNWVWRTQPEITLDRQAYLNARRLIQLDIQAAQFPFKDVRLTRADIEWLLVTHENGRGPIYWDRKRHRGRTGLDLRGADLRGLDLSELPLARLMAGISWDESDELAITLRLEAAAHLEGCTLIRTHLEKADLTFAHLEGANLFRANLELAGLRGIHFEGASLIRIRLCGANLEQAHFHGKLLSEEEANDLRQAGLSLPKTLPPADLRSAFLDNDTTLRSAIFGSAEFGFASVADVRWGGVNLAVIAWPKYRTHRALILGDELRARSTKDADGQPKSPAQLLDDYNGAVRAARQLSLALRNQGLDELAAQYGYRAQVLQRSVFRRQGIGKWGQYIFSVFLDGLAGYGFRPGRSVGAYIFLIAGFAVTYFDLGVTHGPTLTWNEALVISITAFHGRGFFPGQFRPGDPQAAVAALEAILGLLIEISFIATFTQRFFSSK